MIDATFRNINRLFIQMFKTGENDPTSDYCFKCHMPLVKIKDFNALLDNKLFL